MPGEPEPLKRYLAERRTAGTRVNLNHLGDLAFVAIEARHPKASMLLDLYHLHKGGSDFSGLSLLNGAALRAVMFVTCGVLGILLGLGIVPMIHFQ